ncbi:MAG: alkaline shock response membrane anchor protein AmaP [Tepidiformaceae bacterium]
MNALARALLVLYSLLLIAACVGVGLLAWNEGDRLDLNAGDLKMQAFIDSSDAARWALTGVLAAIALFALGALAVAFGREGRGGENLRVRQADGGYVTVSASAMERLISEELERLPDIRSATPRVRMQKGGVATDLDLAIEPGTSISHITTAASQTTAQVLREQVGVADVRRPSVRIRYDEAGTRPMDRREPVQAGEDRIETATPDDTREPSNRGEEPRHAHD